jgi:hypothetical protein
MRYPKEHIALHNEQEMLQWLKSHKNLLPLTLYSICKEIGWTFGATRGTLIRLRNKSESQVMLKECMDPKRRKFQTKVALKETESEVRLNDTSVNEVISYAQTTQTMFTPEELDKLKMFLMKLQEMDANVEKMIPLLDSAVMEKFLEYKFGLETKDKEDLRFMVTLLANKIKRGK